MSRYIAIDLGSHSVKASVFRGAGRKFSLESRHEKAVPQDGTSTPSLPERLVALDELLKENWEWSQPANTFAVTWPSEMATLHHITLPFTDRAQIERTLPFAIESEVPFELDDMLLSWTTVTKEEATHALVALVPRSQMQVLLDALAERSIDPKYIFIDGQLLGLWTPEPGSHAIVDVGHASTQVSLVVDGRVQRCRSINIGGSDFTKAIERALECSFAEAEKIKHGEDPDATAEESDEPSLSADPPALAPKAQEAVDGVIGWLLAEARSSLIAAEDEMGVEFEKILLTGGGSKLHQLPGYFRSDLGVDIIAIHDQEGSPIPAIHACSHALGAASSGLDKEALANLRAGDFAYRGGGERLKNIIQLAGVALACFSVAAIVLFFVQTRSLSTELDLANEQILGMVTSTFPDIPSGLITDGMAATSEMQTRTTEALARASLLTDKDAPPPTLTTLSELTKAFPAADRVTVDVSDLTISATHINLTAETDGYASAASVEEALQQTSRFKSAVKGNEKKKRDRVSFTVTIPLQEKEDTL
jgi:Tfp pilus assembly PilM family ATPase